MKRTYALCTLLLAGCVIFSYATAQAKGKTMNMDFARKIAVMAIKGGERAKINAQIAALGTKDLKALRNLLVDVTRQDPPLTTSIADTWIIYSIVYDIDDRLGTLHYTKVVEGTFNWERATSLVGTTELDFITDSGEQFFIFTTVATVDKASAYFDSDGRRVRLYIREEPFEGGEKRNHVVKIEPLY